MKQFTVNKFKHMYKLNYKMNIIYSIKEFDIFQHNKKSSLFKIVNKNNQNCSSLFYSIIKNNIANSTTIVNDNNNYSSLLIKTLSIKKFNLFIEEQKNTNKTYRLSYETILKIIYYLSKQLFYLLEKEQKCFYTFDHNNILVIDNCKFLYLSNEHLKDVKNDKIYIYNPIKNNLGYLSPELQKIYTVPIIVNYKTIFYSLGLFIINNLLGETIHNDAQEVLLNNVLSIRGSKLYYFLERCLHSDPTKRFLIYL